jgi:hypothetical protein
MKTYYYRARVYDPAVGRFLGEDPLRFAEAGYCLYRYVTNSPLAFTDPLGTTAMIEYGIQTAVALGTLGAVSSQSIYILCSAWHGETPTLVGTVVATGVGFATGFALGMGWVASVLSAVLLDEAVPLVFVRMLPKFALKYSITLTEAIVIGQVTRPVSWGKCFLSSNKSGD